MSRLLFFIVLLLAAASTTSWLGMGPFILNTEGEVRVVKFLGSVSAVITEPGLHFAVATETIKYDGRWLHLSSEPTSIQTLDQEPLVVDNFAVWRVQDPLRFNESFPSGVPEAEKQLAQQVKSRVREVIGLLRLEQVLAREVPPQLSLEKAKALGCLKSFQDVDGNDLDPTLTEAITARSCQAMQDLGIEIAEVRLSRTEIPAGKPEEKVYDRMRSEREELAKKYRAEGEELARKIRAGADRDAEIAIERARSDATKVRGQGDAGAAGVFAEAFGRDPEFYEFVRSLEAYRKTLGEGTTMVLPPDHPFLKFLQSGGEKTQ